MTIRLLSRLSLNEDHLLADFYHRDQLEPVLHILPHWNWPGKEGHMIPVWVQTNCQEVELFLNGISQGRQTVTPYHHLEWNVKYAPGMLTAKGVRDGKPLEASVQTTKERRPDHAQCHLARPAGGRRNAAQQMSFRSSRAWDRRQSNGDGAALSGGRGRAPRFSTLRRRVFGVEPVSYWKR